MYSLLNAEPDNYSPEALKVLSTFARVDARNVHRQELLGIIPEYDILITRLAHDIDSEVLSRASRLKAVVTATTGLDHIDLEAAEVRGIGVLSLQGEVEFLRTVTGTAELTWGLLLSLVRRIPAALEDVLQGNWRRDRYRGNEVKGKILGVVGIGRLGTMVARYGRAFGMVVLGCDPYLENTPEVVDRLIDLEELLAESDIVTLHVPLNSDTEGLIDAERIGLMKPTAVLINTSRAQIVDEKALLAGLKERRLGGAGLDVLSREETIRQGSGSALGKDPLVLYARANDNLLVTPHVGGATVESMHKTEVFMAHKLAQFLRKDFQGGH